MQQSRRPLFVLVRHTSRLARCCSSDESCKLPPHLKAEYDALFATYPHHMPTRIKPRLLGSLSAGSHKSRVRDYYHAGKNQWKDLTLSAQKKLKSLKNSAPQRNGLPNTIMLWLRKSDMNQFYHYNLIHAHQFGQSFVIDCGYEKMLSGTLLHNLYEQIAVIYNINRQNKEPFKLHLCNLAADSALRQMIEKGSLFGQFPPPLIEMTEFSYLDLFPRSQLVYLSNDAKEVLHRVTHDNIYILGGLTDCGSIFPKESMAKAKKEGIPCRKLPNYIKIKGGTVFTMPVAFRMVIEAHDIGMRQAMENVIPQRLKYNDSDFEHLREISAVAHKNYNQQFEEIQKLKAKVGAPHRSTKSKYSNR